MKRSEIKRRPLADTVLEKLEPEVNSYREKDGGGLYIRVLSSGAKLWELRYKKLDGKWSWLGIGSYGSGSHQLKAEAARKKAREILDRLSAGMPAKESRADTFKALAMEWFDSKVDSWVPKTSQRILGGWDNHIFPQVGDRRFTEITTAEWLAVFKSIEQSGALHQLEKIRSACSKAYMLAKVTGRINHNPIDGLTDFLCSAPKKNMRHVTIHELPDLMVAIRGYGRKRLAVGIELLALVACRPGELRKAKWCEFDLNAGIWDIPEERMKMRRPHVTPLSRQAIELLHVLKDFSRGTDFVLPSQNNPDKPISDAAFGLLLKDIGYHDRQTAHGFRHIFSTVMNEQNFNSDHIEAQLAHAKGGVAGVYNKARYFDQRRTMMQWYADYLDMIVQTGLKSTDLLLIQEKTQ